MNLTATAPLLWAYAALAFASGVALLISRWPHWAKALVVAAVTALYFLADSALDGAWGWPSRTGLPERFVLLALVVDEPSKKNDGALYVWVQPLKDGKPTKEPRGHRLPYTKDLHTLFNEGMKKTRQGVSQLGTAEPRRGSQGYFAWLKPGSDEQDVKIRDLPLPQLPEK
jgi:hypothetical protein